MLTEKTGRTPQELAAELAALRGVDWPWVWAGPPQGGSPAFREWCARYGWESQNVEGNLIVHTRTGGELTFGAGGSWNPVDRVDYLAWDVSAGSAGENAQVFSAAAEAWPVHLAAVASALGAPTWTGPWDAPDFPEPAHESAWGGQEFRLRTRSPYQLAYWSPFGDRAGQPLIVLKQTVSFPTWTDNLAGGSTIRLIAYRPQEAGDGRQ
ncbi:hypothetical protein ACFVXW_23000 [Streptomyces sp. NPDC058251]|uniref:hypothetical protein n=1 Tax=unclassified Streptomyces TaxID=2593676 RepID=UPI0036EB230F